METVEQLRAGILNDSLPLDQRQTLADFYIAALADAVSVPTAEDPEVAALSIPWGNKYEDPIVREEMNKCWRWQNAENGWHADGPTPAQAIAHVHKARKRQTVDSIVSDRTAHRLIRLAAAKAFLGFFPRDDGDPRNKLTPEKLVANRDKAAA